MNEKLREIAGRYEVPEESIHEILTGLNIKNLDNPGKRQLKGFERVCSLIKEGKPKEEAIAIVVEEAKNGKAEDLLEETEGIADLDKFIDEQAKRAADATLESFPNIAREERQRLQELFVQKYRQHIAERLQDPQYRQQFEAMIEGQEPGKSNSLNGTASNIALPSSSSSSS